MKGEQLVLRIMIQGYVKCCLVCAAAKLGIADELAGGPRRSEDLATALNVESQLLFRLMRGFASCGLVHQLENGQFELTALGSNLRCNVAGSLRPLAIRVHDIDLPVWQALSDSAKSGEIAFDSVFRTSFYNYLSENDFHRQIFDSEMTHSLNDRLSSILASYDFHWATNIVELGCGQGYLLREILRTVPLATGIFFDCIPLSSIQPQLEVASLRDRCSIVVGNFLESVPPNGDLYILHRVLHNWSNSQCLQILGNCRNAMSKIGKLLIIEQLMPERIALSDAVVGADLMMYLLVGGAERTISEFKCLLSEARLQLNRLIPLDVSFHILEITPSD